MARAKKAQAGQVALEEREQRYLQREAEWQEFTANLDAAHNEAIVALNEAHQEELLKQSRSHAEQIRSLTTKHRKELSEAADVAEKKVVDVKQALAHAEDEIHRLRTFLDNLVELDPALERFRHVDPFNFGNVHTWQFDNVQTAVDHLRTSRLVEKFQTKPKAPNGLKIPG